MAVSRDPLGDDRAGCCPLCLFCFVPLPSARKSAIQSSCILAQRALEQRQLCFFNFICAPALGKKKKQLHVAVLLGAELKAKVD